MPTMPSHSSPLWEYSLVGSCGGRGPSEAGADPGADPQGNGRFLRTVQIHVDHVGQNGPPVLAGLEPEHAGQLEAIDDLTGLDLERIVEAGDVEAEVAMDRRPPAVESQVELPLVVPGRIRRTRGARCEYCHCDGDRRSDRAMTMSRFPLHGVYQIGDV
jgi:hypothetical protein